MIFMIGTSDRLCWLAETCKILLLLLQIAYSVQTGAKAGHDVAIRLKTSCAITARTAADAPQLR